MTLNYSRLAPTHDGHESKDNSHDKTNENRVKSGPRRGASLDLARPGFPQAQKSLSASRITSHQSQHCRRNRVAWFAKPHDSIQSQSAVSRKACRHPHWYPQIIYQSVNYRKFSRNSGAFAINEIALWLTKVTAGRSDNFAHPGYKSFSPGTDVLYCAVLRVAAALDAGG